ncbi:hypothetical protein SCLCIDRAFT_1047238 [Scleroderma citrinum Foug A]|uniref:Uncharacterized protein n=1 Tax=Scleroderma citrinum Foug A TaxID=1036808 RepID=A0A0C3DS74_9AGAM|nr:hypothetical protein SCLCIDRAFT_1047238 [Scleroderma citrinum Foug A]
MSRGHWYLVLSPLIFKISATTNNIQLMVAPPFAFCLSMVSALMSDLYNSRGLTAFFSSVFCIIGFSMFYASTSHQIRYDVSLFFSPRLSLADPHGSTKETYFCRG